VIIGLTFKLSIKKPPQKEVKIAREYLAKAQKVNAESFAYELFRLGKLNYDMAIEQWGFENKKFITYRRYGEVSLYALKSIEYSKKAIEKSYNKQGKAEDHLKLRISAIERKIEVFNKNFGNYPVENRERKELARSEFLLSEGNRAWKQSDFFTAEVKLDSAEILLDSLISKYKAVAEEYFQNYPEWKKWFEHAVKQSSRKKNKIIVVDKYARKCMLYSKGRLTYSFDCELGKNWPGNKMQQGDKATPEGHYKTLNKKSGGETRYYKALLLNYPNESDRKRFNFNKKNGNIDNSADIGGMIEIHGGGGKGFDWTEGCIALKDSDMDILFNEVSVEMPVLIVGSLNSLEDIMK
jgi:murein L,D-transpeptidase YafK